MKEHVLKKKEALVSEIKEKIEKSQSMVLVDYRGLNVDKVTQLRKSYREAGVEYKVYKNTMMTRAFNDLGYEEFTKFFEGPNGIAFSYEDAVGAAKISNDFAKENDALTIKAGIVDGKIVGLDEIKALAELPPKEVLIAQVLGGLNSPIQGFANVLSGTMRSLVTALDAIRAKQENN
ncbi:MAG: 50S ribosomal protein L10 [Tissierellia bacterium]|nr:50S ribosomal protein L10 [Tissierellia bacterium]